MIDPAQLLHSLFSEWSNSDMSNLPKDLTDREVTMLIKGFTGGAIMASIAKDKQDIILRLVEELKQKKMH